LDFFTQQSKLQMEARTALAQAKELVRIIKSLTLICKHLIV